MPSNNSEVPLYGSIKEEDWIQWKNNAVTRVYVDYLRQEINTGLERLLNLDPSSANMTIEQYGLRCATLRAFVDGLGQAADIDNIKEDLVEPRGQTS